ncbi:uncharacterized protein LOC119175651 isoform X3 [Rhipicephalus microplus]|uniref:uncharacterized protein LOC119175651 isoform X3 n=1 Tax=Rhipicephalus microplus TaxID=6941 RepID=UPI003F6AB092
MSLVRHPHLERLRGCHRPEACSTVPSESDRVQNAAGYQSDSPVDSDSGAQSVRTSSPCTTSYLTAIEGEDEEEDDEKGKKPGCKDDSTQTPLPPYGQSLGTQAVQPTQNAESQTEGSELDEITEVELQLRKRDIEIFELQERLACIQEEHVRKMQKLHLRYETLQKESLGPTMQHEVNQKSRSSSSSEEKVQVGEEEEEEKENEEPEEAAPEIGQAEDEREQDWPQQQPAPMLPRRSPPAGIKLEEELHALSIEPRPKQAPSVDHEVKRPAERPQVPEFYDLYWRMEQAAASSDVESMCSSHGGSPTKSKTEELQIGKIILMLKKKKPDYSEQELRRHVDCVRQSQGGFSRMTFNHIVALVLGHMQNSVQ